ncbi:MBL fold metallo-hydrolase [Aliiglaciecola litoralis]
MTINVHSFFHSETGTASYLLADADTNQAAIIDSVLDFDVVSGKLAATIPDQQLQWLEDNNCQLIRILETHAHADHLSAAQYLKQHSSAQTLIGKGIISAQNNFKSTLIPIGDASDFDRLLEDEEIIPLGKSQIRVMSTPGHTDDSVCYLVDDNIFVGDTLFMPDGGTARCDFPGGSAAQLWESIAKIHALPSQTKIWVCHDYQPNGRAVKIQTTVAQSHKFNIHVNKEISKEAFISMRTARDATLALPTLIYPSLQVNLRAGKLPEKHQNGVRYISIPLVTKADPDVAK